MKQGFPQIKCPYTGEIHHNTHKKYGTLLLGVVIMVTGDTRLTAAEALQVKKRAYVAVSVLNYRDQPSIKGKIKGFTLHDKVIIISNGEISAQEIHRGKDDQ
jgi:hypothetical protein